MSQRINITLPDELFKKLQEVKDNINVSRVCQQAISQAIYREKSLKESISDKEKLIARLKKEREEFGQDYKKAGYKQGLKDANHIGFESFRKAELFMDAYSPEFIFGLFADVDLIQQVKKDVLPEVPDESVGEYAIFREFKDLYFDGWLSGILDVWGEVKGKLATKGQGHFFDEDD